MYVPVKYVTTQQLAHEARSRPIAKAAHAAPEQPGFGVCVGSAGTACRALADCALGATEPESWSVLTGTTLDDWLAGVVGWYFT